MIGQTISHYKILEKLGEGGMGVVYKAQDTKLNRTVALKFLPLEFTSDSDAVNRFINEAQAASALDHANICTIYEIDETEDGRMFICMAYYDGETLRKKVASVQLSVNSAIDMAKQIAAGLQRAHEAGIVHRDIKPENLIITTRGEVKIIDFGIAKLAGQSRLTKTGSALGTMMYMSPEQLQGQAVDHRGDIWALRVVFYEMLAGQSPFRGEYEAAMVYSILNEDPRPVTDLRPGVPMALDGIIAKALAKDREIRYQHVDELPADLKAIATTVVSRTRISGTKIPAGTGDQTLQAQPNVHRLWIVAAICFVVALAALTLLYLRRPPVQAATIRFFIPLPEKSALIGFSRNLALSPDGLRLAFTATDSSGRTRLWVRPLDALSAHALAGTDGASNPFWSPDNRYIGFYANTKLKKIEVAGGPPLTICDAVGIEGGAWNKDDMIIAALSGGSPIRLLPAAGGAVTVVTKLDTARKEIAHYAPCFLPDGKHFLYFANTSAAGAPNAIYVASLDLKVNKLLLPVASNVVYASGYLLFRRDRVLMAQPFDVSALELKGDAIPIAELGYDIGPADFCVSENGILAYRSDASQDGSKLLIFDRGGKQMSAVGELDDYRGVRFSPDGQRVAADIFDSQTQQNDIWLYELRRGIRTRLTFNLATDRFPIWSPDGNSIVFHSDRKGVFDLYQKASSGAGSEEIFFESKENKQPFDWSWDGRFIAYTTTGDPKTRGDVWVLPLFGDRKPIPFLQTEFDEGYPYFSPDGRWIAYVSDESKQPEVYVRPFPGPGGTWQISTAGGTRPGWRRDGKELFYLSNDNKIMAVEINATGSTLEVGVVRSLFEAHPTIHAFNYDVSGDGQRFIVSSLVESQAASSITLVVNWTAELKKK